MLLAGLVLGVAVVLGTGAVSLTAAPRRPAA
jgi:hypothetical protein